MGEIFRISGMVMGVRLLVCVPAVIGLIAYCVWHKWRAVREERKRKKDREGRWEAKGDEK